jgi:hypothetical protein
MGRTYPNEINRILYMPGGDVGRAVRSVALDIAEEAKREAIRVLGRNPADKPRTGKFAESYQVRVIPGTNQFVVRNPKKYAAAIELGARPHIISARRTEYLQFRDRNGNWRRVKFVKHPGNLPFNILRNSATRVLIRRFGTASRG